jgi:hypothetical protein
VKQKKSVYNKEPYEKHRRTVLRNGWVVGPTVKASHLEKKRKKKI